MLERLRNMPPRQRLLLAAVLGIAIAYFVIRGRQQPAADGGAATSTTDPGAGSVDQTPDYSSGDPYGLGLDGSATTSTSSQPTLADILATVKQARGLLTGLGWTVKPPTKSGGHKQGGGTSGGGGTKHAGYRDWLKAHPHAGFKQRWDALQLYIKKGWGDPAQLHEREKEMRLYAQRHRPKQQDKGKGSTAKATAGEHTAQERVALPTAASVRAVRSAQQAAAQPRSGSARHAVQATVHRRPAPKRRR